jgi:hypothetical protein
MGTDRSGLRRPSGGDFQRPAPDHAPIASRPRPTRLPAHPALTGQTAMRMPAFGQPQPRRNVRQPGPRPMSTRPCPAGHRPSTRHASRPEAMRPGEWTNGTEGIRTSSIATTTRRPAGTRRAFSCGAGVAAWQPRSAPRWQHCQRDRYHGSDQAAAWCRSSVQAAPWRTALLRRFTVERRANGEASSVMARRFGGVLRLVAGYQWPGTVRSNALNCWTRDSRPQQWACSALV